MSTQPARGMRDFLPEDVRRREYVVGVIREVYDRYGFEPLETPAAENIDTLLGKYGEEGNKLIFKILKRGEHEASGEADLALRYDLTVPLARVVAEYRDKKIPRIFKRYQIQPVWRADRPARGRYREFYQCDIDSLGSTSPAVEAEQIAAVSEILGRLGFQNYVIRLNHRGLLTGMLARSGVPESLYGDVLVALDKRDKIGEDGVKIELGHRGLGEAAIRELLTFSAQLPAAVTASDELDRLEKLLESEPRAIAAISNLREIFTLSENAGVGHQLILDKSLARGLSYYTGAIMEINVTDLAGSLGGGGRYDNLIGMFLGTDVPACGFSIGLERIVVVMEERGMFPAQVEQASVDLVVAAIDEGAQAAAISTAAIARRVPGLRVDLYPDVSKKMDKVFKYVDQRKARFLAVLGGDEVAQGTVSVRDVAARKQETMRRDELGKYMADRAKRLTTAD